MWFGRDRDQDADGRAPATFSNARYRGIRAAPGSGRRAILGVCRGVLPAPLHVHPRFAPPSTTENRGVAGSIPALATPVPKRDSACSSRGADWQLARSTQSGRPETGDSAEARSGGDTNACPPLSNHSMNARAPPQPPSTRCSSPPAARSALHRRSDAEDGQVLPAVASDVVQRSERMTSLWLAWAPAARERRKPARRLPRE
jgi:hypothetical protein